MTRLFLTTALVMGLAVPAFAAKPAEGEKLADKQEMNYWILDALKSLDPHKNTDREGSDALRQLFEGLMNEDINGAMVPGVAESYEVSDDKLVYTFHLRDAKWSNGDPVTAGDFVYGWRRIADPATASEYAWFMELMNVENAPAVVKGEKKPEELGIKAIDDKTLEVRLSAPTPYLLKTMAHPSTFPAPQKVIEAEGDNWTQPGKLVGNGAYKLDAHYLGVQAVLSKNDNYWDAANTILTTVRFVTVNDQNIGLTRLLAGELDWMDRTPAGQFPRLQQEYPDQAVSVPDACSYAYLFNLSDKGPEALKDLRVRQALSYAVDRDIIVDKVLQGGQKPAYWWTHWATEGFQAPDIEMSKWTQPERVEKAKALLAEAGYGPDKPLKLSIRTIPRTTTRSWRSPCSSSGNRSACRSSWRITNGRSIPTACRTRISKSRAMHGARIITSPRPSWITSAPMATITASSRMPIMTSCSTTPRPQPTPRRSTRRPRSC